MRHGIAISLLLILGTLFPGVHAVLLFRKCQIRSEMKERLLGGVEENEMVRLSFDRAQIRSVLRWEHDGEFEYRGEMYDIVKTEFRGDSVFYWCIHDRSETLINRQLEALTARAAGSDPPTQEYLKKIFDFFKKLCAPAHDAGVERLKTCSVAVHTYNSKTEAPPFAPPYPPPKSSHQAGLQTSKFVFAMDAFPANRLATRNCKMRL